MRKKFLFSIPIKCISCQMKGFQKECDEQTDLLIDRLTYLGKPHIKNVFVFLWTIH